MYREAFEKLLEHCRNQDWQGYDPYDALCSPLCSYFPDSKYLRMAWTQLFKRSAINLRPLVGISKGQNPKGLGLAVRALLTAYRATKQQSYLHEAEELLEKLYASKSTGYDGLACWGYNFAWQSRAFYAPIYTPSIVCTTFIAHAWLDHYEVCAEQSSLDVAVSACEFLLKFLNHTESGDELCFSYTPLDRSQVHNANLLGAELLARTSRYATDAERLRKMALRATRFSLRRQAEDGSWPYGTAPNQQWIDSFHTGFNLVSLARVISECGENAWISRLEKGLEFYGRQFFLADGTPKYYHNAVYPIDIHSSAQAVVTYSRLRSYAPDADEMIDRVMEWTLKHMRSQEGYFYFQKQRFYTNRIDYMRWSQAWMLYALAIAAYDR